MHYSPVILIVYTRKNNLENLIESLKANSESKLTDLFIISDAASKEEDIKAVNEVRLYADSVTGFNSIKVIKPEKNSRIIKHNYVLETMESLLDRYGSFICLEDDNIVSVHFLHFMNEALNYYKESPIINCICGYSLPIKFPKKFSDQVYLGSRYSPWGIAMRKEWFYAIDRSDFDRFKIAMSKPYKKKFLNIGHDFLDILEKDSRGIINADDARVVFHQIVNNQYSLFPTISLVRNVGHDGTGEHCEKTDKFLVQLNNSPVYNIEMVLNPLPNKKILRALSNYINYDSFLDRLYYIIKYIPKKILKKLNIYERIKNKVKG